MHRMNGISTASQSSEVSEGFVFMEVRRTRAQGGAGSAGREVQAVLGIRKAKHAPVIWVACAEPGGQAACRKPPLQALKPLICLMQVGYALLCLTSAGLLPWELVTPDLVHALAAATPGAAGVCATE